MRLNFLFKIFLKLWFIASCVSCASFPKYHYGQTSIAINKKNVTGLNGEYSIHPLKIDSIDFNWYSERHTAYENFYRTNKHDSDTLEIDEDAYYSFKIELINEKKTHVEYLKNGKKIKEFNLKFKLKPDGFLYLKNKNFKFYGVPYILGGINIKKLRLGMDVNQNIIIEEVNHRSGAFLFLLGMARNEHFIHHYKKENN